LDYATYNESELRAFKSARGVSDYLNHLRQQRFPDYSISVCAHSMGNIVMMEALRRDLNVGRTNINNYVLMQAAAPAHCYDTSLPNYAPFISAEQGNATPDTYRGYPGAISGAVRNRIINFYNTNDFALATAIVGNWEQNQRFFKPNTSKGYTSDGTNGFKDGVLLTENREVMSFVSRPRSKAVGAQPGVGGVITSLDQVDLKGNYGFDTEWDEHSAQFNWNIQRLNGFYAELVAKLFSEP
jgi:pimeloyl-ACP methyl ester carboxylesterase